MLRKLFAGKEEREYASRLVYTLSGGAAYGYAHIGILKFLEEQGLKADAVVGTSMGAIVGGLYACGYEADELEGIAHKLRTAEIMRLFFPSFPRGGIIDTDGIREFIRRYTSDRRIEDLEMIYRSVAVDVESGEEIIFDSGLILDAMMASMSIPAIFKPYPFRGRSLVDGGVLNNLPWDIARELGSSHVIANVAPHRLDSAKERIYTSALYEPDSERTARENRGESRKKRGEGEEASFQSFINSMKKEEAFSFKKLLQSLSQAQERKDQGGLSIPEIVTKVMAIINEELDLPKNSLRGTFLYVHPDLSSYSLNDFHKAEEIISRGYTTASEEAAFCKGVAKLVSKRGGK